MPRFACATSTALYPGWAVLALPPTPSDLTTAVNRALPAMPRPATVDPRRGTDGWIAPVSYAGVEALYREPGLYPFAPDLAAGLARWLRGNALWVALGVIAVGLFLLHVAYIEWLVRRRTRALERIVEQANRASAFIASMWRVLAKEPEHPERLDLRDVVDEAVYSRRRRRGAPA